MSAALQCLVGYHGVGMVVRPGSEPETFVAIPPEISGVQLVELLATSLAQAMLAAERVLGQEAVSRGLDLVAVTKHLRALTLTCLEEGRERGRHDFGTRTYLDGGSPT